MTSVDAIQERGLSLALQDGTKKETIAASSLLASFSHLLSSVARSVEQTDAKLCLLELKKIKEFIKKYIIFCRNKN